MIVRDRKGLFLAVVGLAVGFVAFLAITGPRIQDEVTSSVRRAGGVCLELERWTLLGWHVVGQTHSVHDMQNSLWRPAEEDPPCAEVPEREYLVRVFDQAPGRYRLCGLADENECARFELVGARFRVSGP